MDLLTLHAPVRMPAMFLDADRFFDHFDLLDHMWGRVGVFQGAATVGTMLKRVIMDLVNLFRRKGRTLMPRMAGLTAAAPLLLFPTGFIFGRLNDIAGGWLGRIARMFPGCRQLSF